MCFSPWSSQLLQGPSEGHQSRNQLLAAITKSLQVPGSTEDGKEQSCDDVILEDELEMLSIDEAAREKADGAISAAFLTGTQQTFDVLLKLVLEENYPLDYTVRDVWINTHILSKYFMQAREILVLF